MSNVTDKDLIVDVKCNRQEPYCRCQM